MTCRPVECARAGYAPGTNRLLLLRSPYVLSFVGVPPSVNDSSPLFSLAAAGVWRKLQAILPVELSGQSLSENRA